MALLCIKYAYIESKCANLDGKGAHPGLGDPGFESHLGWDGDFFVIVVKRRDLDLTF